MVILAHFKEFPLYCYAMKLSSTLNEFRTNDILNNLRPCYYHQEPSGWSDLMWVLPFLMLLALFSRTIWCSLSRTIQKMKTTKHKWLRISKAFPSNQRTPPLPLHCSECQWGCRIPGNSFTFNLIECSVIWLLDDSLNISQLLLYSHMSYTFEYIHRWIVLCPLGFVSYPHLFFNADILSDAIHCFSFSYHCIGQEFLWRQKLHQLF